MSKVSVTAIEPFDGNNPGARVDVSLRQARQLVERGLAKMSVPASNKMRPAPANKANPTQAVGEALPSSALPAVPALQQTTATTSGSGNRRGRKPRSSPSTTAGE